MYNVHPPSIHHLRTFDERNSENPCNIVTVGLFVCVEVLLTSQPDRVMSSAVSTPNHTFTGQA